MCNEIEVLKDKIVKSADPEFIILFGQKNYIGSDKIREVNLCIVVSCTDCKKTVKRIYLEVESDIAFNIIVYTHEEWLRLKNDDTSYVASIIKKGVLIYEKA